MTERIAAPFTDEQVAALNDYQASGVMHPFTCGKCRETLHTLDANVPDERILTATPNGWTCRNCDYTQDWAWAEMADRSWEQLSWFRTTR